MNKKETEDKRNQLILEKLGNPYNGFLFIGPNSLNITKWSSHFLHKCTCILTGRVLHNIEASIYFIGFRG